MNRYLAKETDGKFRLYIGVKSNFYMGNAQVQGNRRLSNINLMKEMHCLVLYIPIQTNFTAKYMCIEKSEL